MPKNVASFREWVSGECIYSAPPAWQCNFYASKFEIVPSWKLARVICVFLGGFVLFTFISLMFMDRSTRLAFGPDWFMNFFMPLLVSLVMLILAIIFGVWLVKALKDHRKGPYLVYSEADETCSLPREGLVLPRGELIGWRLVAGNWFGPKDQQKKKDDPAWELQLIAHANEGPMAYAIIGVQTSLTTSADPIVVASRRIASITRLPLDEVQQHQGLSYRVVKRDGESWRT